MKIESIRLKNYKAFRNVHLKDIPSFLVVVGANGSGKSTLFDVFGFLHDCLKGNVRQALDKRGRFAEVLSRGCDPTKDTIVIEVQYRMEITGVERLVTYSLEIGEHNGAPVVQKELPALGLTLGLVVAVTGLLYGMILQTGLGHGSVVYLLSDAGSFTTGTTIVVDGGMTST